MTQRLLLVVALLLAGCASQPFDNRWPQMEGKSIDYLVRAWGPPEKVTEAADNAGPVYIWRTTTQYQGTDARVTSGMIGATPISLTTETPVIRKTQCQIAVLINRERRIKAMKLDGQRAACDAMAERL
jgi:hypothetical protein